MQHKVAQTADVEAAETLMMQSGIPASPVRYGVKMTRINSDRALGCTTTSQIHKSRQGTPHMITLTPLTEKNIY